MNHNFNFFNDKMKDFMNPDAFTQGFKGVNLPDFSQISESIKRNSEALTEAGKIASESAQAIMRRGAEIAQDNASHLFNTMKEVASSSNPEHAVARQQQFVQHVMQQTVGNAKEMMDMTSKAVMEVFEKISDHASTNVAHVMTAAKKSTK
jgi:phasin family protein